MVKLKSRSRNDGGLLVWGLLHELTKYTLHAREASVTSLSLVDPLVTQTTQSSMMLESIAGLLLANQPKVLKERLDVVPLRGSSNHVDS